VLAVAGGVVAYVALRHAHAAHAAEAVDDLVLAG
jgi:hypothetical protein